MVDPVFGDPAAHSAIDAIVAIVAYAIVIYADFSGYTDIAIGVAKLLGLPVPRRTSTARTRRARCRTSGGAGTSRCRGGCATTSTSRSAVRSKGETRTYVNIVVTMVLGGLWHGAAWTFVVLGALPRHRPGDRRLEARAPARRGPRPRCSCGASASRRSRSCAWGGCSSGPTRWRPRSRCSDGCWSAGRSPTEVVTPLVLGTIAPDAGAAVRAARAGPRAAGAHLALAPGADGARGRRRPVRDQPRSVHRAWHPSSTSSSDDEDDRHMTDDPRATLEHPDPHGDDSRTPVPHGRQTMPAGKVLDRAARRAARVGGAVRAHPEAGLRGAAARHPAHRVAVGAAPGRAISDFVQLTSATDGAMRAARARPRRGAGRRDRRAGPRRVPDARPGRHGLAEARRARGRGLEDPPADPHERAAGRRRRRLARRRPRGLPRARVPPGARALSRQGRISTGLSRLDYFDWIGAMQQIENGFSPDLVVVMIGDNDNQSLQSPGGQTVAEIGSFEWPRGYEDRVEEFTRIAVDGGAARGVGGPADRAAQGALGRDAAPERHLRARRRRHPQRRLRRHVGPVRHARRPVHALPTGKAARSS